MPGIPKFTSARDLFEATRDAAISYDRQARVIEELKSLEAVHGQAQGQGHGSSKDVNGTGRIVTRIDLEARAERQMQEQQELIDYACALCFGRDGNGGVASLLSEDAATVLYLFYCRALKWQTITTTLCRSTLWCRTQRDAAFELIDSLGYGAVVAGIGVAELLVVTSIST